MDRTNHPNKSVLILYTVSWRVCRILMYQYFLQDAELRCLLAEASVEGFSSQDMGHNKLVSYADNYYRESDPRQARPADMNNTRTRMTEPLHGFGRRFILQLKDLR
ncbi:MAG: hypothetical protein R2757_14020 [Draconibacterium sp.]